MNALVDSNILIDYLRGVKKAKKEIGLYNKVFISMISWMEVMVGTDDSDSTAVQQFLSRFHLIDLTRPIAERAVLQRRQHRIRLPDAIIWASAIENNLLFVTRNTKDFSRKNPSIRIPYSI